MFTNGRSGSNFVVDCLNQHPLLCNYGEVLGSYMPPMRLHDRFGYGGRDAESYLDFVLSSRIHFEISKLYSTVSRLKRRRKPRRKRWSDLTSIGIKDFAIRFDERDVIDYLAARPYIKVISLHRENTLRRAISLSSLMQTGVVRADRPGVSKVEALEIDVDHLVDQIAVLEHEKKEQLRVVGALDPARCLRLTYEDLFASEDRTQQLIGGVYRFLGVEPIPIRFDQRKILPTDLERTIRNYAEVASTLRDAGLGHYLDGP